MWLNAGAVTLGVGAAMVGAAAVASADTGAAGGHSATSVSSHSSSPAGKAKPKPGTANKSTGTSARTRGPASAMAAVNVGAKPKSPTSPVPTSSAAADQPTTTPAAQNPLTTASATAPVAVTRTVSRAAAVPTPNQLLSGLQQLGRDLSVTVSNQMYDVRANLATLRDDLAQVFGISRVVVTTPGVYGNPTQNKQYFVAMPDFVSAALSTVAMAYGQLTGTAPDLPAFVDAALNTGSLAFPGNKIYRGPGTTWFVKWTDSYELLQDKGVRVITRYYNGEQQSRAVNDLVAGLSDPTKVMIAAITGPVDGRTEPGEKTVIVIGVDTTRNIVTINDPTRADGQGLEMKYDDFLDAWGKQNYLLVTTQLAASSSTPLSTPATKLVWSLPAPNEIGGALQNAGRSIALAVVHQIQGAQTNLADLATDLAYTFGVNDPSADGPPASGDLEYGNYTRNLPYLYPQGKYATCAIMATAAIIAQLRGGELPPDLGQQILDQATSTPSGRIPGETIYETNGGQNGLHWGTYNEDVVKLLNMNGVNADWTTYLKKQGDVAMDAMTSALNQQQGVMVSLASNVTWNAYLRKYFGRNVIPPGDRGVQSDHVVVVISVNLTKKIVYLNDSAMENGQGFPVPLDDFMKAWQYSNYSLITAELPADTSSSSALAS
ncbi:hypothetical protein [Mycolicibacterium sp. CBM1]